MKMISFNVKNGFPQKVVRITIEKTYLAIDADLHHLSFVHVFQRDRDLMLQREVRFSRCSEHRTYGYQKNRIEK